MKAKVKLNIYSFITVFLWAAAFPLTKVAGAYFSPYDLGLIRCTVAAASLLIIGMLSHMRKPLCKRDLFLMAITGIFGFALYLIFFNTGIMTISSATSSVIVASTPIMTAIVCSRLYDERISPAGRLAIFLSFMGVIILLFWKGALSIEIGVVWTLAAAVVFCIYNVLSRRLVSAGYSSVEIVTYGMISAAAVMMVFLPGTVSEISQAEPKALIIAAALGVFPSAISYFLWAKAMSLADKTSEVTNYMFITPLLSTVIGFLLLGEIPDMGTIIGGVVIIAGVILFAVKGSKSQV